VNTLIKNDTIATALGRSQDSMPYLFLARTQPGYVEMHKQLDDMAIIRSGHGTLKTGYQVAGKIRATVKSRREIGFAIVLKMQLNKSYRRDILLLSLL